MSKLDDIIFCIGSPWGEGATYERTRLKSMEEEGLEASSHMSRDEEQAMKADIKALMLELIESSETATTQGGVYMIAAHDLIKKVEEL